MVGGLGAFFLAGALAALAAVEAVFLARLATALAAASAIWSRESGVVTFEAAFVGGAFRVGAARLARVGVEDVRLAATRVDGGTVVVPMAGAAKYAPFAWRKQRPSTTKIGPPCAAF